MSEQTATRARRLRDMDPLSRFGELLKRYGEGHADGRWHAPRCAGHTANRSSIATNSYLNVHIHKHACAHTISLARQIREWGAGMHRFRYRAPGKIDAYFTHPTNLTVAPIPQCSQPRNRRSVFGKSMTSTMKLIRLPARCIAIACAFCRALERLFGIV